MPMRSCAAGTPDAEDSESLERIISVSMLLQEHNWAAPWDSFRWASETQPQKKQCRRVARSSRRRRGHDRLRQSQYDRSGFARNDPSPRDQEHLYAFIATPHTPPRLVDLGKSDELRKAIGNRWYSLLRRADSRAGELKEAGLAVRRRFWDVLALDKPERVFMVPDGIVYRLNFAALPDDRRLSDRKRLALSHF